MTRILHITQSLDPTWGGIAAVLPELAKRLVAAGLSCRIAVLRGDRFGTPADVPGVEVIAFDARKKSPLGRSNAFNEKIPGLLANADILHLHGLWAGQNWSAGNAARAQARPIVISPHSHMMPWAWKRSAWKKRPVGWLFEHRNLRTAAVLHALAEGEAAHMRRLGFNERIEVIPNGIDPALYLQLPTAEPLEAKFPATAGKKWLLFLGRLAAQKGIYQVVDAMMRVLPDHPEWHAVIAGPDPFAMRTQFDAMIGERNLHNCFTFTNMLDRDGVRACLGRASILVQPSFSEGLSMSILEALASRLPVLISPGCNMPEVATADAGRIVEPKPFEIAGALNEMMTMSDRDHAAMGDRARALVLQHFAWPVVIPKYEAMYARALRATSVNP